MKLAQMINHSHLYLIYSYKFVVLSLIFMRSYFKKTKGIVGHCCKKIFLENFKNKIK